MDAAMIGNRPVHRVPEQSGERDRCGSRHLQNPQKKEAKMKILDRINKLVTPGNARAWLAATQRYSYCEGLLRLSPTNPTADGLVSALERRFNICLDLATLASVGDESAGRTLLKMRAGQFDETIAESGHMTASELTDMLMDLSRVQS